jgi:hypothetical protein
MSGFKTITYKLQQFTRKYYVNELIKGIILFFSFGLLYLLFTLFLEYFLWLKPTARTFLFWIFILVEVFLLLRFIATPIFRLIGIQKGISFEDSSKIIGRHFPEVKDKLLNVIQLQEDDNQSDLLMAGINQKAEELQPIPFIKAVDFGKNTKYLKYAIVPVVIWLITIITGNYNIFKDGLERVVNHRMAYTAPAPFYFNLQNKKLKVIQGNAIEVAFETLGTVVPVEAKIVFDKQEYYLQNSGNGRFTYLFSDVQEALSFYVTANGVQSEEYKITVVNTPTIEAVLLKLKYPYYVGKSNETIPNAGNVLVPEGTKITWVVSANQTEKIRFITNKRKQLFKKNATDNFVFSKEIRVPLNYQITSSNKDLKDFDNLQFAVNVIKDEDPKISVISNIDSIFSGLAQFAGRLSDDYGLNKLELVYFDGNHPENIKRHSLPISKSNVQTFFYQFPEGIDVIKGANYELYFEVFDNDGINGSKKAKSSVFKYRQKTAIEVEEELLQEQRKTINNLERGLLNQEKQNQSLAKIQQDLQRKKKVSWNDKKKVDSFIKRQQQYKKMMQRQTEKLQETLDEKTVPNKCLEQKKDELNKRIEELRKTDRQEKLLAEIAEIAKKLNKEELVKKAKELAQQNKQQERSLERTLELVKRFYVEQKTMQIAFKLNELAKKQEVLEKQTDTSLEEQKKIQTAFDELKKELEELARDNEKLKEPIDLPDVYDEKRDIDETLSKVEESLKKDAKKEAKQNQQKSAEQMKKMSGKMQKAMMEMEGDSIEENMEDLRKVLENLVTFSFKQEKVMNTLDGISTTHPDFGKELKKQNDIRSYFEHIDDSLYVLSMRLPKISGKIQHDLSTAHYNLEQSLENFSEGRFDNGVSNQRYVMTASNNLADYLSTMLNSMKNASMKMGKGKGKGKGFSLPDIIKKQGELSEKMKNGIRKGGEPGQKKGEKKGSGKDGKKPGEKGTSNGKGKTNGKGKGGKGGNDGEKEEGQGENNDLDGELYEIYKEQSQLRQQLQEAIKESKNAASRGIGDAKKVLKTMEQLENEILNKGFNAGTIQKMQRLNYELLKLDKATLEQGEDIKRKSISNKKQEQRNNKKAIEFKKQFYNQIEILNRQSLPLQQNYKLKVREYFSETNKKQE